MMKTQYKDAKDLPTFRLDDWCRCRSTWDAKGRWDGAGRAAQSPHEVKVEGTAPSTSSTQLARADPTVIGRGPSPPGLPRASSGYRHGGDRTNDGRLVHPLVDEQPLHDRLGPEPSPVPGHVHPERQG